MARHGSPLLAVLVLLAACDSPVEPVLIFAPDLGAADAVLVDAAVDGDVADAEALDAATPELTVDTTAIDACDAANIAIPFGGQSALTITPILDGSRGPPVEWAPNTPFILNLEGLAEGAHSTAFEVWGLRLDGPEVRIDRSPPRVSWPADADACVVDPPSPDVDDLSRVRVEIEDTQMGCRTARVAHVIDACGLSTIARRTWRVGPPGLPTVIGERAFSWTPSDPCTDEITAQIGRVGERAAPYVQGEVIEWPGDYALTLTATGCNGPAAHAIAVQVPAGLCDRATTPLDSAPNVRGWLQISSQRLVDLSLVLLGRDLMDAATPMREAATLLARHPGFPGGCPAREECLIGDDWQRILAALNRSTAALDGRADTRGARRCLIETARVVVAASAHAPDICRAPLYAAALVEAWDDEDARQRIRCLCSGDCAPNAECRDASVLRDTSDPIEFNQQIVELAGATIVPCLDDPGCAALPAFIEQTRAAVRAGDCAARGLLSVAWLIIGRHCAGVGRFRHPGTDALAAAVGRWPLAAGSATTLAHLERAIAACLPAE